MAKINGESQVWLEKKKLRFKLAAWLFKQFLIAQVEKFQNIQNQRIWVVDFFKISIHYFTSEML